MTTTFFYRIQRAKGIVRWSMVTVKQGQAKQPDRPDSSAPITTFCREVAAECARLGDDNVSVLPFQRATKRTRKAKSK